MVLPDVKIISGRSTLYLAEKITEGYGEPLTDVEVLEFSDGEFEPIIQESIRGSFVFIIQSTPAPSDNLMELLMLIDAAKRASAGYIIAVMPYFGLARQDRKDKPRVAIGAKLVADLLTAAGAHRVMTMDLHAPQIQGFFNIPVDHLVNEKWEALEQEIQKALETGVIRYPGTARPGEKGNVFITGHSSYYLWAPGAYKDVFALLPNVEVGDTVTVYYNQRQFVYEIQEKKTVKPTEVDVLRQGEDKRLTLMTCVPVGTNLNRLILVAKEKQS